MNKRLKQLVLAATCMVVAEASPLLVDTAAYAAEVSAVESSNTEANVSAIQEAVIKINNGTESISDYKTLEIKGVTSDNLPSIKYTIKKAKIENTADLTKDEVKKIVGETLTSISNSKNNIHLGQATIDDYTLLQIADIDTNNLADVNVLMTGCRTSSINKIRREVEQVLTSINNVNNGTAVLDDYYNLEINSVNSEYVSLINKNIKKNKIGPYISVSTVKDIIDKVNSDMDQILNKIYKGTASIENYKYICEYDVNETNIQDVNEWMTKQPHTDYKKVVYEVNNVVSILKRINNGTETLDDFYQLGIDNVSNKNLSEVNQAIKDKRNEKGTDITKEEIKNAINESTEVIDLFAKINLGKAVVNDYEAVDVSGVKDYNLSDVNKVLKGKNYTTSEQVQASINSLLVALENINNGDDKVEDYNVLDINNINKDNIQYARGYVKDKKADKGMNLSKYEIKECAENASKCLKCIEDCNAGIASLDEYSFLGINDVKEDNIKYVNAMVKGKNFKEVSALKELIVNNLNTFDILVRVSEGKASIDDYKNIGITTVKDSNLNYVNTDMSKSSFATVKEVSDLIRNHANIYTAFSNINAGTAKVSDYSVIKVTGVTSENNKYVNLELKDKGYDTAEKVQDVINENKNFNNALVIINKGQGHLEDYKIIGAEGVTETNLPYINKDIKGAQYATFDELKDKIKIAVKTENSYIDIYNGKGTLEEYNFLNISGVDEENLAYINREVINDFDINKRNLQPVVTDALKFREAVTRINEFTETISGNIITEYKTLGLNVSKDWQESLHQAVTISKLIKEDYLNRREIVAMETKMLDKNNPDSAFITEQIIDRIGTNTDISGKEAQDIVDKVISDRYEAIKRIAEGKASVEDFKFIGDKEVTAENLHCVNTDIALRKTVKLTDVTKFKNSEITNAVNLGVAIYNINIENDTVLNGVLNEYKTIGLSVQSKWQDSLRQAVRITKAIKEDYLTKDELAGIVSKMTNASNPDAAFVTQQMIDRLDDIKKLSGNEVDAIVKQVIADRYAAIKRIAAGKGSIDDFAFIGHTEVTDENLQCVDTDIELNKTVNANNVEKFRNSDLNTAVNIGIAIYNINKEQDTVSGGNITDYKTIGVGVSATWANSLRDAIRITKTIKGDYLVRSEIIKVQGNMTSSNNPDSVFVLNQILDRIGDITKLSGEEVQAKVDEVIAERYARIEKIAKSEGTLEDFAFIGHADIEEKYLKYINTDIELSKTVPLTKVETFKNRDLDYAIKSGIAIYNINKEINTAVSGRIDEYQTLKDNVAATWTDNLKKAIAIAKAIKEEDLVRSEILDVERAMTSSDNPDSVFVMEQILDRIGDNKDVKGQELQAIVDQVIADRYAAINRIANAEGRVEDFAFIGHSEVTEESLQYINTDIKLNKTVPLTKVETFKNKDLTSAVDCGIAIYRINKEEDTVVSGRINEYFTLKDSVTGTWTENLRKALRIAKAIKGEDLVRSEILDVERAMTSANNPDSVFVMEQILDRIGDNKDIKGQELQAIVDQVIADRYAAINRIANAEGRVEDFAFIGHSEVTEESLPYINTDIKLNKTVPLTKVETFKNRDLTNAVDCGIAIYKINKEEDTVVSGRINEYLTLKENVSGTWVENLRKALRVAKAIKGEDLVRSEIIDVEKSMTSGNNPDSVFILEQILEKASKKENVKGQELQDIVDEVLSDRYAAVERIQKGAGTVSDFALVGHSEVTEESLKYVNTDIILNKTVTLNKPETVKNADITNAVNFGLAIYKINNAKDTITSGRINEYSILKDNVSSKWTEDLRKAIKLAQLIKEDDLTRDEILDVERKMTNANNPDSVFVLEQILDKAAEKEDVKGQELQAVVDKVVADRYAAVERIQKGEGTVDDFICLGHSEVTSDSLTFVNEDIKLNKTVTLNKAETVKNKDITNAVNIGLAIYKINTKQDTVSGGRIKEYSDLGLSVSSSYQEKLQGEIEKAISKKGSYLTREEIKSVKTTVLR